MNVYLSIGWSKSQHSNKLLITKGFCVVLERVREAK